MSIFLQVEDFSRFDDFSDTGNASLSSTTRTRSRSVDECTNAPSYSHLSRNNSVGLPTSARCGPADDYQRDIDAASEASTGSASSTCGSDTTIGSEKTAGEGNTARSKSISSHNLTKQSSRSSIDELLFDLYDKHGGNSCLRFR